MTAPALPGAAPDPARLPPEVEKARLVLRRKMGECGVDGMIFDTLWSCDVAPILAALGGDGEPVAWLVVCRDGVTPGIAYLSRESAEEHIGVGETIRPLFTRPAATGDTGEWERTLPTRGDVGRPEATRDPVFILQYRDKGRRPDSDRWRPVGVWFTREEAETFAAAHAHRWPDDRHGKRWQVYCVPADGEMARLLKAVTLRAVATPAATGGPDAR